ncbi:MAG: hypothetical protein HLUCCA12_07405 [Rhodobacteraceae bacterium HLUCCA12]|nr:MAG: hypothetical protein HLUCCA12_07405 [Rhodobacteraceae bacterium HLUCCA12]
MNICLRSFVLTCVLAISMAAGALVHGMAQATPPHGSQAAVQEIVICADGAGETVITIDTQGNRIDPVDTCPPMPCPDCLASVSFALPAVLSDPTRRTLAAEPVLCPLSLVHPQRPQAHRAARGPPQKV